MPRTRNDLLIALTVGAIDVAACVATSLGRGQLRTEAGITLTVLGALCLLDRRRRALPVLGAVLAVQLAVGVITPMPDSFGATLAVALFTVIRQGPARTAVLACAATLGVSVVRTVQGSEPFWLRISANLAAIAIIAVAAVGTRTWQRQLDLNRRLLAERAVAEERRRIARELHDIVAHHITTMYLMSGGARATLDTDPGTAREALVTLEASGREALSEMRQLLGVLRSADQPEEEPPAPQPGVGDIERLVAEASAAGQPTELRISGEPRPLPLPVGLALYRVAQEALTNVRKHAGSARTRVRIAYAPDEVTVEVVDDGAGGTGASPGAGGGYGLLGMRERVSVHGGSLEAGSRART
ncbi:sensor histidine kinase, partial [Streptomyces boncukensis]